jgi:hypothetical protein
MSTPEYFLDKIEIEIRKQPPERNDELIALWRDELSKLRGAQGK